MFTLNINPVLLRLGPVEIRYYGIIYALGFVFALWYLLRLSKRGKLSLSEDEVYDLMIYLIVGVLIGARLFEILFYHPVYYFSNPGQIISYWNGGLSFHGGLVGALVAGWLFLRKKKRKCSFYELADAVIVPAALALSLGRIANFINGELYGKVTSLPWGVKFPGVAGYRHPTQIYESLAYLAIFIYLYLVKDYLTVDKKHGKGYQGYLFWMFVALYGLLRFIIEFWKEPETLFLGVPVGQIFSAIMLVIGGYVLLRHYSKKGNAKK
jgi:phosphatidylglycerol:prolipoprotein diacylglycerol transferase